MLLFLELVDKTQTFKPQNFKTSLKQNITCKFLSVRPNLLLTVHYETPCTFNVKNKHTRLECDFVNILTTL